MVRLIKTKTYFIAAFLMLTIGFASGAAMAEAEKATLNTSELVEQTQEGLDLMWAGDWEKSKSILFFANDQTQLEHDYPDDELRFPNLALARYFYEKEDYPESIRFSASVAAAMDKDNLRDHPYSVEAIALHGFALVEQKEFTQALPILQSIHDKLSTRTDLEPLKLEVLLNIIKTKYSLKSASLDEHFLPFYELFSSVVQKPVDIPDQFWVYYINLQTAVIQGESPKLIAERSHEFITKVVEVGVIPEAYAEFYKGYHGRNLADARDYEGALPYLESYYDYFIRENINNYDFYKNGWKYASVGRHVYGPEFSHGITDKIIAIGEDKNASDVVMATSYANRGFYANMIGLDSSQEDFRKAYAILRTSAGKNSKLALAIKKNIILDDPEMKGYKFAAELGALDLSAYALKADGSTILQLYYEGNYAIIQTLFDKSKSVRENRPGVYHLNFAIYQTLIGHYDESQTALKLARKATRNRIGGEIPANSPLFDIVDLLGKVVFMQIDAEGAEDSFKRLSVRLDNLTDSQKRLYYAIQSSYFSLLGDDKAIRLAMYNWSDLPHGNAEKDMWDIMSDSIADTSIAWIANESEIIKIYAKRRAELEKYKDLKLLFASFELTEKVNIASALQKEDILPELTRLYNLFQEMLPPDSQTIANTELQMSSAMHWRGRLSEALVWIDRSLNTLSRNPNIRADTIAYLFSRKATLLAQSGRADEAVAVAKAAYDMSNNRDSYPNMFSMVLDSYAASSYAYTERAEFPAELIKTHMDDPIFFNALTVANKFVLARLYATYLADFAPIEEAIAAIEHAENILSEDEYNYIPSRSLLLYSKSRILYWDSQFAKAYEYAVEGNDLHQEWKNSNIGQTTSGGSNIVDWHALNVVSLEAAIAWDYAKSIETGSSAPQ